ncbi:FAD-binding oxidoreductase [Ferrimonas marina]|uniref:Alkyldihydroxyacetonephosphate synthase n=1 Tax=Ferrimonas marina TaxID=299255 RepID=A0A1M5YUR4_9GAMM|nr:FAD-binding oxidoreductase [Ferrimonas marina]SHI15755.1 alkyldihydroxyacetonephosphate synthase [Ferrimonas marina]
MERIWNGWSRHTQPLPPSAFPLLEQRLGSPQLPPQATLQDVLALLPPSRLPEHPCWDCTPMTRLTFSRGQSLPDWIALKSGQPGRVPDAVAQPGNDDELRQCLNLAKEMDLDIIPYGGGTSVTGHVSPRPGQRPVLTIAMGRFNRLLRLDSENRLATFGAGISGPQLEAALNAQGYTLGHFPQSFEFSTLGGWVATRSSGQQSLGYGRIEQLFAGAVVHTLTDRWVLPPLPASAAGPNWRELLLGSEGRLGILSQVTVRVQPKPAKEQFFVSFLPDWRRAKQAVQQLVQQGVQASMFRLSHPNESEVQLMLSLFERRRAWLYRLLKLRGIQQAPVLLVWSVSSSARRPVGTIKRALNGAGAVWHSASLGRKWASKRFDAPHLRDPLWQAGYCLDTLETAIGWDQLERLRQTIEAALNNALTAQGQPVLVFSHISHVYPQGASLYVTYLFPYAGSAEQALDHWQRLKRAASEAIVAVGGTISHQHGVGQDHKPYLSAEIGQTGQQALEALSQQLDPDQRLNPGVLLP